MQADALPAQGGHVHIVKFHEPPVLPESPHVESMNGVVSCELPHVRKEITPGTRFPNELVAGAHFPRLGVYPLLS